MTVKRCYKLDDTYEDFKLISNFLPLSTEANQLWEGQHHQPEERIMQAGAEEERERERERRGESQQVFEFMMGK
jgi:hypothetical protein